MRSSNCRTFTLVSTAYPIYPRSSQEFHARHESILFDVLLDGRFVETKVNLRKKKLCRRIKDPISLDAVLVKR